MKIEVGKIYSCGDWPIIIMHIEPLHSDGGIAAGVHRAVGGIVNYYGEFSGKIGLFNPSSGSHSIDNPACIRKRLEEIPDGINFKRKYFSHNPREGNHDRGGYFDES